MKRLNYLLACVMVLLVACQPTLPLAGLVPEENGRSGQVGTAVRIAIRQGQRLTTQTAPMTGANVARYVISLVRSSDDVAVATVSTGTNATTFTAVASGTYYATVDARNAADVSIVQGALPRSSNTVTVSGATVVYSVGSSLDVTVPLADGTGGQTAIALSGPYSGAGVSLVSASDGRTISSYTSPTLPVTLGGLADGSYYLWSSLHGPGGVATPAVRSGPLVVSGSGSTVTGSVGGAVGGTITTSAGGNPVQGLGGAWEVSTDAAGNAYVCNPINHLVYMIPRASGTYFGQAMSANGLYVIAGNGVTGAATAGTVATATAVDADDCTVAASGNLYIASNHCVYMVPQASGTYFGQGMTANHIYLIAGGGSNFAWGAGDLATTVPFEWVTGIAVDATGNLYLSHRVFSGSTNTGIWMLPNADGTYFGQAMLANRVYRLTSPFVTMSTYRDVALDSAGNVYYSDDVTINMIPRVAGTYFGQLMFAGPTYTIAGTPIGMINLADDIPATTAHFDYPDSLCTDAIGNVYVADSFQNRVRVIPVTSGTYFGQTMTAGSIYTVAGSGVGGYNGDSQAATSAALHTPMGVHIDSDGNVLIADHANTRLRIVDRTAGTFYGQAMATNFMYSYANMAQLGDAGPAASASFAFPAGVAVDAQGNQFVADRDHARVRMIPAASGTYFGQAMTAGNVYTVAGNGTVGTSGDGGPATAGTMMIPTKVALDSTGNLFILDASARRIRMVPRAGGTYFGQAMTAANIYTVTGGGALSGDGVSAPAAALGSPSGLALDGAGNLYIADAWYVRIVPRTSGVYFGLGMAANAIYSIAGSTATGPLGDGGPGTSAVTDPRDVALDSQGNVLVAEYGSRVRLLAAVSGTLYGQAVTANRIYTVAGTGALGSSGDGGPAAAATLNHPAGLTVDGAGNVYVADAPAQRVRVIDPLGFIYTVAGTGMAGSSGDGGPAGSAALSSPCGVAVLPGGGLVIADAGNNRIRRVN